MPLRQAQRDDPAERMAEDVDRLFEDLREHVGEARQSRRRERRGCAVAGKIRDDQPLAGKERRQFGEVPGGPAEAVYEQQARALPALEGADHRPAPLVEPFLEAPQKNRRIRHVDRLFWDENECDGDKAERRVMSFVLHREELET